jgi:hypothetical protein
MINSDGSSSTRQLLLYFSLMPLLVNLVNPGFLLDIPTSAPDSRRSKVERSRIASSLR